MKNRCKDMTFMLYSITFAKKITKLTRINQSAQKTVVFWEVNRSTSQRVNRLKSDESDKSDGSDADTIVSCTKTIVLTSLTS